jgi:nucleotide-binding universal stress UspA family protein
VFDNVLIRSDCGADGGETMAFARLLADPEASFALTGMRDRSILEIAERDRADLIVLGSRHDGIAARAALHHQADVVIHGARCAVAIAPPGYVAPARLRAIGIGHNASPEAIRGLAVARVLARRHAADLCAMASVSLQSIPAGEPIPPRWPEVAADLVDAEEARLWSLGEVDGVAVYGEPGEQLAEFGRDLDLLVVGSRGLGRLARLRAGSTTRYLIRHATCPLLVIGRRTSGLAPERESRPVPVG